MKARLLLALAPLLLLGGVAWGQGPSKDQLEKNYQEKLHKKFTKKVTWVRSYEKALEQSKETGKPIFAYFTRSYAR